MTDEEYDELFNPPKPKEPTVDNSISKTLSVDSGLRKIRESLMYD